MAWSCYPDTLEVPLVGAAPAGRPLLAIENVEETLPLPKGLFASGDFALRVNGDSMVEAHPRTTLPSSNPHRCRGD